MHNSQETEVYDSGRLFPKTRPPEPISTPLSILDATVARFTPTGAIWVYNHPTDEKLLTRLKSSFIDALGLFPQWAGQLQWAPLDPKGGHTTRFNRPMIVHGADSDPGVEWVVARSHHLAASLIPERKGMVDVGQFPQSELCSSTPLALHDLQQCAGLPSMLVQVTLLREGYAVSVKLAHPLADAHTLMLFMRCWTAFFHNNVPESPLFDPAQLDRHASGDIDTVANPEIIKIARSLPLHRFDWWATSTPGYPVALIPTTEKSKPRYEDLLATALLSPAEPAPWSTWDLARPLKQMLIHFSNEELRQLRDAAGSVSRLDALLAHCWVAINRARRSTESYLDLTLGARGRVEPPLPDLFVGSPLFLTHVHSSGDMSVAEASTRIRGCLTRFTPDAVGALLHDAAHEVAPQRLWQAFLGSQHVLVTSWLRLSVYDIVLGAQPAHVHAIMPKMDGCLQVMDGDDGVDVLLCLDTDAANRLKVR